MTALTMEKITGLVDHIEQLMREPCTPNDRANARGALGELRALLLRIIESGLPRESGIEIAAHELVRCIATPSVNDPWNTLGENQKLTYLGWARETVRAYLAAERAVDIGEQK